MTGLVTRPWSPNHLVGRWLGLGVSSLSYNVLCHLCLRPPDTRSLSCNLRQSKNVFSHCYMSPNRVHGTKQRTALLWTLPCHTGSAAWYLGDTLNLWLGSPTCYVCISTCHSHVIVSKTCCHRMQGTQPTFLSLSVASWEQKWQNMGLGRQLSLWSACHKTMGTWVQCPESMWKPWDGSVCL